MSEPISRHDVQRHLLTRSRLTLVEVIGAPFFEDAHLPGAVNLPPDRLDELAARVIPSFDDPVVVYDAGGGRVAAHAAERLEALGYRDVVVYHGGKADWIEHGLAVQRTPSDDG